MKEFKVKIKDKEISLNLPTSKDEITSEYLDKVTREISIAPNYVLIALIYRAKLFEVINIKKNNKDATVGVVAKFVKAGDTDNPFIRTININDTIIISGSDISIGQYVSAKNNELSIPRIKTYAEIDKALYNQAIAVVEPNCFLEFKIVPENAIRGVVTENASTIHEFIKD